jgi:50S ribosomal subunit-associated GTPase HflX
MSEFVANGATVCELLLPLDSSEVMARLHRSARVLETEYLEEEARIVAILPARLAEELAEFIVDPVTHEKPARAEAPLPS